MSTSILVVEDEPAIQELIAYNLKNAGHQVIRAFDAEAGARLIQTDLPDVILLDWNLPGISGIQFARRLRADKRTRRVPIIMLTARSEEQDMVVCLDAGADDCMIKPFSPRELMARIKAVLRGRSPQLSDDDIALGGIRLVPATQRVDAGGRAIELGPTEFRLLHFLMTHPDSVHGRPHLLDKVWGDNVFVTERTVDVHIGRLRAALEATGHDALIQTLRGSGYRFSAPID